MILELRFILCYSFSPELYSNCHNSFLIKPIYRSTVSNNPVGECQTINFQHVFAFHFDHEGNVLQP